MVTSTTSSAPCLYEPPTPAPPASAASPKVGTCATGRCGRGVQLAVLHIYPVLVEVGVKAARAEGTHGGPVGFVVPVVPRSTRSGSGGGGGEERGELGKINDPVVDTRPPSI